jgi:hypothetical protein
MRNARNVVLRCAVIIPRTSCSPDFRLAIGSHVLLAPRAPGTRSLGSLAETSARPKRGGARDQSSFQRQALDIDFERDKSMCL